MFPLNRLLDDVLRAGPRFAIAAPVKTGSFALIAAGAAATAAISLSATVAHGPELIALLERQAKTARDEAGGEGIAIRFTTSHGWLTRHPQLTGGEHLSPQVRARVAMAVSRVPGVGGVRWRAAGLARDGAAPPAVATAPLHCQTQVEGILRARSIRFSESSAAIDPASETLLDEVAAALRPCVGSIIAITGHTDAMGYEGANLTLSRQRAEAVRRALIGRGIPADGLRAAGVGSGRPVAGLDPKDAANRRIEFSVIATRPVEPTPVDPPGQG